MTPSAIFSWRPSSERDKYRIEKPTRVCLCRNSRLKCRRNDVDEGEAEHVIRDASTSTTANDRLGNHNRGVAPMSIRGCHIEEPAGHTKSKNNVQGYLTKGFRFLGRCPSGSLSCLLVFPDHKRQNAPGLFSSLGNVWHLLMPRHLLMAFGPRAREKRNTFFHVSEQAPLWCWHLICGRARLHATLL